MTLSLLSRTRLLSFPLRVLLVWAEKLKKINLIFFFDFIQSGFSDEESRLSPTLTSSFKFSLLLISSSTFSNSGTDCSSLISSLSFSLSVPSFATSADISLSALFSCSAWLTALGVTSFDVLVLSPGTGVLSGSVSPSESES